MNSLSINTLDIVVVAVLLLSAVLAFFRGFVHEILSIAAWVGASVITLRGLPMARPMAHEMIALSWAADAAAAGGLFLGSLLILSLLTRMVAQRVQNSGLGSLDRALGFGFGLARGGLILSLVFVVVRMLMPTADTRPDWLNQARTAPLMERGADLLLSLAPQQFLNDQEKARLAAEEAQEKAQQALEMKQTYDKLIQPRPGLAEQESAAHPQAPVVRVVPSAVPQAAVGGGVTAQTPPVNATPVAPVQTHAVPSPAASVPVANNPAAVPQKFSQPTYATSGASASGSSAASTPAPVREKAAEKTVEKVAQKTPEKTPEKAPEKVPEKTVEKKASTASATATPAHSSGSGAGKAGYDASSRQSLDALFQNQQ